MPPGRCLCACNSIELPIYQSQHDRTDWSQASINKHAHALTDFARASVQMSDLIEVGV